MTADAYTNSSVKTPHSQGRIRYTGPKQKVRHVEDQVCPLGITTHVLENTVAAFNALTGCAYCGVSWSRLDAALRSAT